MNPETRSAVLVFGLTFCVIFIGMTLAVPNVLFLPPRTMGELLADVFTLAGIGFVVMLLIAVVSALRDPPDR
jgi:hypothetical protein